MDKRKSSDAGAVVPAKRAKAGNGQQLVAHAGGGRALVAAVRMCLNSRGARARQSIAEEGGEESANRE